MKKNIRLMVAIVLALVMVASCVAMVACKKAHVCQHKCETCGLCTDAECNDPVCEQKCTCEPAPTHKCEHVCDKCNKCKDPSCKDPVCEDKCAGHEEEVVKIPITGKVRYDLGVIQGFAKISNADVSSKGDKESYVTNFSWEKKSSVTMEVWCNATDDVQGDLVIKVRKTEEVITLTHQIMVNVNGDVLESEAQVPSSAEGETADFVEVNLGQFWLSAGKNVITISPQSTIKNFDFSAVIFYSTEEAKLEWNDMHGIDGIPFYGVDSHVTFDGGFKLNVAENCLGVGAYAAASATFPVYSSRQAKAELYIITNSMPLPMKVTDYFDWTINDRKVVSNADLPYNEAPWGNYKIVKIGEYLLDAGLNTIKLSLTNNILQYGGDYNRYYNLRGIIIDTDANIGFDEQTPEAHVCLSECDVCHGCKNEACQEDACETKCSCAHTCESVCAVCGGCKNTECDKEECQTKCDCTMQEFKLNGGNVTIDNQTYNEKEDCVGCKWTAENGYEPVTITYKLTVAEATKVKLYMTVTRFYSAGQLIGGAYDVTINGEAITSEAQYVAGTPWAEYDRIYVGTYELVKGANTIVIVYAHAINQDGGALNFRCITLEHSAAVSIDFATRGALTNVEIEQNPTKTDYGADEVFDSTGLKLKLTYEDGSTRIVDSGFTFSEEPLVEGATGIEVSYTEGEVTKTVTVAITVTDPKTKQTFVGTDVRVGLSSAWVVKNGIVDNAAVGTDNTITFNLFADKARKAELYLAITTWPEVLGTLTDIYRITVNGKAVTSTAGTPVGDMWGAAVEQFISVIELAQGDNTIVLTYNPGDWRTLNFAYIALNTAANVTFAEKTAVLESIEIVNNPKKTEYNAGDVFDASGLRIKATYSDNTTRLMEAGFVYNTAALEEGETAMVISYTEGDVTKTATVAITVADPKTKTEFKLNGTGVTIVNGSYNADEDCVGAAAEGGVYIPVTTTFRINSSKAMKAKLYITIAQSNHSKKIVGEAYDISVNNEAITSDAMYEAGTPWQNYKEFLLCEIDLVAGDNTIVVVYAHADQQQGYTLNLRSITLEYSASATVAYATAE